MYRHVYSWKAATECNIPLTDLKAGFCDTCLTWLRGETGEMRGAYLELKKATRV
jgi:hypothetical protein